MAETRIVNISSINKLKKSKSTKVKAIIKNLSVFYSDKCAVDNVSMNINTKEVTAMIGPSGCGKSTFIRCLNRMNDVIENCIVKGSILIDGHDIYNPKIDEVKLRSQIGMVFQKPNPFPKSIYDNVAYGPRLHGIATKKNDLDKIVEESLIKAGLFNEVKDRLNDTATGLSGGQQQRLCIARTISISPSIILMDEPCSALDPIATAVIEELIENLKKSYTIIIVTHNMQQAARVADFTGFLLLGELVEFGPTEKLFTKPSASKTEDYITGRFG